MTAMAEPLRVVSYGGGVQSTALLVLAAQGYVDFPTFLFCNVGDDSEHPDTLAHVREVAFDYAAQHGIRMEELHRVPKRGRHKGENLTLMRQLSHEDSRSLPIPVRMANGAPGRRACTADYKIKVVQRWVQEHGATPEQPAITAIGISTDEWERATTRTSNDYEELAYPLLTLEWKGRVGLSRADCVEVIRSAGLPIPRKSSCYFCPFHAPSVWALMRRDEPELFDKAAELEAMLNRRRAKLGKDDVFLSRFAKPLGEAIAAAQDGLFGDGWDADEGYRCGDVCDT